MAPSNDSGSSVCMTCVPLPRITFNGYERVPTTDGSRRPCISPPAASRFKPSPGPTAAPRPTPTTPVPTPIPTRTPTPPTTLPTPPTTPPTNPLALLVTHLWPHLPPADRAALRLTSPHARRAANALAARLRLNDSAFKADVHSLGERFPKATQLQVSGVLAPQIIHNLLVQAPYLWPRLTSLQIETPSTLDATYVLQILHISTALTHFSLAPAPASYTPALLSTLPRRPSLCSLHLHNLASNPPAVLTPLAILPALSTLHLSHISATPFAHIHALLAHLSLHSLTLTSCAFTPDPATAPPGTPLPPPCQVPHVTISATTGLTDLDVLALAACPTLITLALPASLPDALTNLSFLPSTLRHLDLTQNPLQPAVFDTLPHLPHLTALALSCVPAPLPPALARALTPTLHHLSLSPTPPGLPLAPLTALTHLSLSFTPRTFNLAPLSTLTALRTLHLPHLPLDRHLLPPLAALPHLHTLAVHSLQVWPNHGTLPALTSLTATAATRFNDADWGDVAAAAPHIRALTLHSASRISDAGLALLPATLPNLTALTLEGLFRVTVPGCSALGAHPALRYVQLGLPDVDPLYRLLLQQALEARGMHVECSGE